MSVKVANRYFLLKKIKSKKVKRILIKNMINQGKKKINRISLIFNLT